MRTLLLAAGLVVSLLLGGCDASEDPKSAVLLPDRAQYAWSYESRDLASDSLLLGMSEDVQVRVVSRDATVPGYEGLVEVRVSTGGSEELMESQTWYQETQDQLREVAYGNSFTVFAQLRGTAMMPEPYGIPYSVTALLAQRRAARHVSTNDSVTVREDPRVVFELPLEVGASWTSFEDPFRSTREIVGREAVTVAAGTFDCFVVRTEIDIVSEASQFEWLDYVSEERGLVLRTVEQLQEYRDENNVPTGLVQSSERLELTGGEGFR